MCNEKRRYTSPNGKSKIIERLHCLMKVIKVIIRCEADCYWIEDGYCQSQEVDIDEDGNCETFREKERD